MAIIRWFGGPVTWPGLCGVNLYNKHATIYWKEGSKAETYRMEVINLTDEKKEKNEREYKRKDLRIGKRECKSKSNIKFRAGYKMNRSCWTR